MITAHLKGIDYRYTLNAELSAQVNLTKEEGVLGTEVGLRIKLEDSGILQCISK